MRRFLAVGILFGSLAAGSAFAADWQEVSKTDAGTTSLDKQSLKRVDRSRVRASIMYKFSQPQPATAQTPEHDMTIGAYVVNCGDFSSVANRNTWYLNSKVVRVFNGPANLPPPPQFERGVPAALKAACDSTK